MAFCSGVGWSIKPAARWQRFADGCGTPLSPHPQCRHRVLLFRRAAISILHRCFDPAARAAPEPALSRAVFVGQTILWASRARLWGHIVSPTKGWLGSRAKERSRRARSPAPFGAAAGSAVA